MIRVSVPTIAAIAALGFLAPLCAPAFSAGTTHAVLMESVDYAPKRVTVRVGDTIEWINKDIVAHTATAKNRSWDVNVMPGKSGRMLMKVPGTLAYFCRYHPNMTGEIIVGP